VSPAEAEPPASVLIATDFHQVVILVLFALENFGFASIQARRFHVDT